MELNELMVGDWVSSDDGNAIIIPPIAEDGVFLKDEAGFCAASYDRINPIPLTAEILEKNGWHCFSTYWDIVGCPFWLESNTPNGAWGVRFGVYSLYDSFYIHYVHELQHALRLVGIEKEITL